MITLRSISLRKDTESHHSIFTSACLEIIATLSKHEKILSLQWLFLGIHFLTVSSLLTVVFIYCHIRGSNRRLGRPGVEVKVQARLSCNKTGVLLHFTERM